MRPCPQEDAVMKRAVHTGAVVLIVALAGCSDGPVQPPLREQAKPALPPLVPQANGQSCTASDAKLSSGAFLNNAPELCTASDAKLSSGALFKICFDPNNWNRDLV